MSVPVLLSRLDGRASLLSRAWHCLPWLLQIHPLGCKSRISQVQNKAEECCEELPWLTEDNRQQPN